MNPSLFFFLSLKRMFPHLIPHLRFFWTVTLIRVQPLLPTLSALPHLLESHLNIVEGFRNTGSEPHLQSC